MRIMLLINSFSFGGAETMNYRIAEYLAKNGDNVFVVATGLYNSNKKNNLKRLLNNYGITTYELSRKRGRLNIVRNLISICKKNDIEVMVTNCKSPDYYGRTASLFLSSLKVYTVIHNVSENGKTRFDEMFFKKRTRKYIAISETVESYCINRLKIKKDKIVTINNGIKIVSLKERNESKDFFNILSVGRIDIGKNYISIAKLLEKFFNNHKDAYWTVIGGNNYNTKYFNEVKSILINHMDKINFIGETKDVYDYYIKSDCFISLSLSEGFGLAIAEAVSSGIPVMSSNVGIVDELIKNGCNVVVSNEKSLDKLENIYNQFINNGRKTKINVKNHEIMRKYYNEEIMFEKYAKVFHS